MNPRIKGTSLHANQLKTAMGVLVPQKSDIQRQNGISQEHLQTAGQQVTDPETRAVLDEVRRRFEVFDVSGPEGKPDGLFNQTDVSPFVYQALDLPFFMRGAAVRKLREELRNHFGLAG